MKFKNYASVFLKGILLGVMSLGIPGVSASTVGIIVGIYFLMVEAIADIFKDFKHNAPFLLSLMLGYGAGAIFAAAAVTVLFNLFPLVIVIIMSGILIAAIINTAVELKGEYKKVSNWITFVVTLAALGVYNMLLNTGITMTFPEDPSLKNLIVMAVVGLVTSSTFIIPGIDFAVVFLSLGIYYPFMNMLYELVSFGMDNYGAALIKNLEILGFYIAGYFVGIFLFSKLIKKLIGKYKSQTQFASFAFVVSAPVVFYKNSVILNDGFFTSVPQYIIGFILGAAALFIMLYAFTIKKPKSPLLNESNETESTAKEVKAAIIGNSDGETLSLNHNGSANAATPDGESTPVAPQNFRRRPIVPPRCGGGLGEFFQHRLGELIDLDHIPE